MSFILNLVAIIRALIDLWRSYQASQELARKNEELRKQMAREKALEDLKNAQTEEEIFDAQSRLIANKP